MTPDAVFRRRSETPAASDIAPEPTLVARLHAAAMACGLVVAAFGVIGLLGWVTGSALLKGELVAGINIKTNAAVCLLLAGGALAILAYRRKRTLELIARGMAAIVVIIGIATLSQHLSGWNLGIDELLFSEPAGAAGTLAPNRMGPPASVCFPLLGLALLLIDRRTRLGKIPTQWFATIATLIAFVPLLGYVFRAQALYGIARYSGISLATAIALVALGAGILCARPEEGAVRRVAADDSGGILIRRLLPAAILVPIVLARLRVAGEDAGLYDVDFGRTLLVLGFIVVFSTIVWWTGSVVSRHTAARAQAEAAEAQLKERLVETLERERGARAAAEHANLMKDEFLATLSHELRTPLQAIVGWAQLLVRGGMSERDQQRGLESIERNARLQAQLIEELLDISRITTGKVHLDAHSVNLDVVIEAAVAAVAPAAQAKGIRVHRSLDKAAVVRGDPARLQQVLFNLLTNALKFTPPGGLVTVTLTSGRPYIEVRVTDTGIGIPAQHLPHVFDRFRQADSSSTRQHGGLGLGLAIARQLIELHGGSVHAESDGEGKGASFVVRLPVAPASHFEPVPTPHRSRAFNAAPLDAPYSSLAGIHVLVVDDQPDARELIERLLRGHNALVFPADTMSQAIKIVDREHIDLVVSDIGMPEHDGFELLREIRARGATMPAIALTAFARPEDRERALAAGYQLHLAKPIDPARLAAAAAELVSQSTMQNGASRTTISR